LGKVVFIAFENDEMIDQLVAEKNASIAANKAKSEFIATASHDLRQPMQSINIGIIENDYSLKNAYEQYYSKAGYAVYLIPHEEDEFTQYLAEIPNLHFILSDYRLGKHDGIFFIQKLREEFNEDIPACIVTADTSPQHLELFDQLNIHVLYKPIDIQTIGLFMANSLKTSSH
jgi:DNA-binding response OmpR family regulator